ncbi:MAG TPA: hypothetical protein VJ736_10395, partial [Actinomycetota bacterium]|nr:hypothetical protein [Actinomycetota bacterium]
MSARAGIGQPIAAAVEHDHVSTVLAVVLVAAYIGLRLTGAIARNIDVSNRSLLDGPSGLRTQGGVMASINEHESVQIDRANASGKP